MTTAGVVEGVDFFLAGHIGFGITSNGEIACGTCGFLATTKADVYFSGVSAHAGASPESGRNALMAAANTVLALHAIPRHSAGASRINVGVLHAGEGRNVIPPTAHLMFETRGATSDIDAYMMNEARRIIEGQAQAYGVNAKVVLMGGALGAESDLALAHRLLPVVREIRGVREVREMAYLGGSEDVSFMMDRVREQGGLSTYLMFGTKIDAPHHNCGFDFDESVLPIATQALFCSIRELCR
jgi:aminobenzoyl-glutamate utilization protein A